MSSCLRSCSLALSLLLSAFPTASTGRRRRKEIATTSRRKLAAALSIELGSLKAIASGAPYVGLAGACIGIMCGLGFGGIGICCRRWCAVSDRSRCARHPGERSRHGRISRGWHGNGKARYHGPALNSESIRRSLPRICRGWFEQACLKVVSTQTKP
jgi:hypothetical protein